MSQKTILHLSPQSRGANDECERKGFSVRDNLRSRLPGDAEVALESLFTDDGFPSLEDFRTRYHALVITGSGYGANDQSPYLTELRTFVQEVIRQRIPVLGICFGHQIVAMNYGAIVEPGTSGKEKGVVTVRLTPAGKSDPLFQDIGETFSVGTYHGDGVAGLPDTANVSVLAENDAFPVQAVAFDDHVRTVQFHPEFDADTGFQLSRGKVPVGDDPEGVRRNGTQVIRNFVRNFVSNAV